MRVDLEVASLSEVVVKQVEDTIFKALSASINNKCVELQKKALDFVAAF